MNLEDYLGMDIIVTLHNGKILEGYCDGYTQAVDNVPEIESIEIGDIEIYENEIKSIKVLDKK